jgi:hypothetical protein
VPRAVGLEPLSDDGRGGESVVVTVGGVSLAEASVRALVGDIAAPQRTGLRRPSTLTTPPRASIC